MAKRKAKRRAPSKRQRAASPQSFAVGDMVRVRSGVWGNSSGRVVALNSREARVQIGGEVVTCELANVERGGPKDRF